MGPVQELLLLGLIVQGSGTTAHSAYSHFARPFLVREQRQPSPPACASEATSCPAQDGSCAEAHTATPFCVSHGTFGCHCKATAVGVSGHAEYTFGNSGVALFSAVNYTVAWVSMPATGFNAYAAVQLSWEGATGYAGTQFHEDGTQMFDFAIWDSNGTSRNSHPDNDDGSQRCARFGGEGTGAHCETALPLHVGRAYEVAFYQVSANASGVTWAASLNGVEMGRLFWNEDEAGPGVRLGGIRADSFVAFHEYYTLQGFSSSVGFRGPVGIGMADGAAHVPLTARCESDAHHNCAPCVPGLGCGRPNVLLEAGPDVPSTNGSSVPIW